jgi:retron-type reverse transcriptase
MKINEESIKWALKSLESMGDSDLFARPFELAIIKDIDSSAIARIAALDISDFSYGPSRRFIVPKDDLSYRTASQLDPLNSIILTALIYEYGGLIESKRRPKKENKVFSYRFAPDTEGQLYASANSWNDFWSKCYDKSKDYSHVVILDIADFYNQIYHHSLENELIESGLPNQVQKWIVGLCGALTAKVSRGIPVGPHASHLLAESVLSPVDNVLTHQGIDFCRYVDDIIIFVHSEVEARSKILSLANTLDKQQKLLIQRHKTKILDSAIFRKFCIEMVEDRPIDDLEKELVLIIKKHSHGNPYRIVWLSELSDEELSKFKPDVVEKIIKDYLEKPEPDYIRLRWFIRRLSQIGHPSGVTVLLQEFSRLLPALSEICRYFLAVSQNADLDWQNIGQDLFSFLDNEIIKSNEYYQLSILSLFASQRKFDNLPSIVNYYKNASPYLRREIIICAAKHQATDWLRELKETFPTMDIWNRRAFIYATSVFPAEERRFFLKSIKVFDLLDEFIISWVKSK